MIFRYISYWLNAIDEHSLQPPFAYRLYTSVIKRKEQYPIFEDIEKSRKELLADQREISFSELGAGSKVNPRKKRQIKDIARNSLTPAKFSELLFRLVAHFKPHIILELGTSLGINTLYLAKVRKEVKVITFEGCPETAAISQELFQKHSSENIEVITGDISATLPPFINQVEKVDFVYFDANHRLEPTLNYFNICLSKAHTNSIFIFDDIHWSREMEEAWKQIKENPKVTMTMDLFNSGLVFFDPDLKKQHYTLMF
ncbi:class I SAM-dependent methyltransferase [Cytophagales bacterium RKSG123]|nr:class I SAM-dependent methyltransferase [Xanthovirga aplysinae]